MIQSACEWREKILKGELSALELTNNFLEVIEEKNPSTNAFLSIDKEGAQKAAKEVDEVEKHPFPFLGIPMAVPDVLDMKGLPTTFGSLLLEKNIAEEDSEVVANLKANGAIIVGKTNVAEFCLSYETENQLREPCRNPLNRKYTVGGGTGGAAIAVATGQVPVALCTDYCGALRMSSSFCGMWGLVPSRGLIPTTSEWLLPYSERKFFRKGAIARCPEDLALVLNALTDRDYIEALKKSPKRLKIGWSPNLDFLPVSPEVLRVVREGAALFEDLGHVVEEVSLGLDADVLSHFLHLFAVDRYLVIMRLLQDHPEGFDCLMDNTKEWLRLGNEVTGGQYSMGITEKEYLKRKLEKVFNTYDMILTPTVPVPPFPAGHPPSVVEGKFIKPYVGLWGFLAPFNMSGHPTMTMPCGKDMKGLPIGMQLVGRPFSEGDLLALGKAYSS